MVIRPTVISRPYVLIGGPEGTPGEKLLRHDGHVEVRAGLTVADEAIARFAHRHGIRRLALYGSVLREDFNAGADIDVQVEFLPGRTPGLLRLAEMNLEIEDLFGRKVEIRTYHDLSREFRDRVLFESVALVESDEPS
jgi:predicted nucleotidyltransferase